MILNRFNILKYNNALINVETCAFNAGVGYLVFAMSPLTIFKIIGVAIIIYNLNDAIANIISAINNNHDFGLNFKYNSDAIISFLNAITLLGILYINRNPIINFIKFYL
jgi:hypothetical protein